LIEAWGDFYLKYEPVVRLAASMRCVPQEDKENLVQETWIQVILRLPSFELRADSSGFRSWLRPVVNHKAIDGFRHRRPHGTQDLTALVRKGQEPAGWADNPVEILGHGEDQRMVRGAAGTPEECRIVDELAAGAVALARGTPGGRGRGHPWPQFPRNKLSALPDERKAAHPVSGWLPGLLRKTHQFPRYRPRCTVPISWGHKLAALGLRRLGRDSQTAVPFWGSLMRSNIRLLLITCLIVTISGTATAVPNTPAKKETPAETKAREEKALAALKKLGGSFYKDPLKRGGKTDLRVDFSGSKFTHDDLWVLADLPPFEILNIDEAQISGAGLKYLIHQKAIRIIWIRHVPITDNGLQSISQLVDLQELTICNTKLTDAGLKHLRNLHQLSRLVLNGDKFTDAGLEHLAGLIHLKTLNLAGTKVSDNGIKGIKQFKELRQIILVETRVSTKGLKELQKALPKVSIYSAYPK
jgi:hypothetical protein